MVLLGLGGKQGKGNQYISWIHEYDFASAVAFVLEHQLTGVVNIVSPIPTPNTTFMKQLRKGVGIPIGLPTPTPLLKLGAKIIGTETELVLKSRNVIPNRLLQEGFQFQFNTLEKTITDLVKS